MKSLCGCSAISTSCAAQKFFPAGRRKTTPRWAPTATQPFEQKAAVTEMSRNEEQALAKIPAAERPEKGTDIRQNTRRQIRRVLSPEQRKKYDLSPQAMGGSLPSNPDLMADRFAQVVNLTPEQKQQARQIYWSEYADQIAAQPEDAEPKPFTMGAAFRDKLRAILTPEQLTKYNTTPVGEGGALPRPRPAPQ